MRKAKKFLSLVLTLIMCFSVVPMTDLGIEASAAIYENAIFPAPRVYLTQLAYESYSHGNQNAIDISPGGNVFAPFTGEIVYLNTAWGYAVLQSKDKVYYADGTLDYMTVGFMHDSNISNLYKGQTIKQGEDFYQAGGMGNGNPNAYGAHVHINVFKGRVTPASVNGNGNIFAYNAFYVNTTRTTITRPGIVVSGNVVYNGAPTNYNGLWKTTTSNTTSTLSEPTSIIYPTSGATYKIASGVGNNMYLVFALSNNNVQIFEDGDSNSDPAWVKSQYFTLNHVGDGWYTITNVGNGSLVDVALADPSSGTNIQQCVANGSNAQLYRFYDAGDGYCYIKSKLGTYVDVQNADNFNRANVWAYSFNGTNAQKWKLIKKDVPNFDTEKPVIRHVEIYNVTLDGYQVYCSVSDNDEVVRVAFPTWTSHNGQDDLIWADGKIFSDQAFFDVKTSDHNNEYGEYITHIYAYDAVGNVSDIVEISVTIEDNKKFTLDYRVVNNTVTITGKGSFDGENLVIPSTIAGFPVTAIGNYAFEGYTNLKSITVPNSVTSIGNYAFWSCENLESIIIGDNITNIGDGAFYRCQSLENITLPKKLTSIGLQSFMFCSKLKNITIPNGVTSIAESAFDSCFSLTSLIIPGSLKNIDRAVFNNCRGLESITINNGVKTISPLAFNLCTNLKSIVIPKSITSIGSNAFNSCEEIKYIFYGGSPTDAKNISIDTGNSSLTSAHWHYETTRHNYSDTVTKHPTCTSAGVKTFTCSCSVSYTETISKVPHSDDDNDNICDVCSEVLGSITPDTPVEPTTDCSCSCHKGGIMGFFFKIILFFQKLFKANQVCDCGIAHY